MAGFICTISMVLGACSNITPKHESSRNEVIAAIDKVNTYWQTHTPAEQYAFWDVAAYHTGNIEAYRVTGHERYRRYSETWAEHNLWMGAKSNDKANWKYKTFGESDEHVLFGDWQTCFQVYADLYHLNKDDRNIARALEVMDYQINTPNNDYWWWVDGLYMAMPVMPKMYKITGNRQYLEKMYEYYSYTNSIMYDAEAQLYYRDANFIYPEHKSINGKKDFWSRGDGWAFAALARVLTDLPQDAPHRPEYAERLQAMAAALLPIQQPEGYWTRSLLDPAHTPGPETSGTAFFTFGLLWGINNGLLPRDRYLPAAQRGWNYLTKVAMQPDGKLGYVQPMGKQALPDQVLDQNSTANFGVGAFLLAGAEMVRLLDQPQ
ncbi:glycoside hydrolase family 88/105 protein [Comamonas composti]|uniref:glycoside hydrolase family 88/105 protein n=1 Tax=Comamonas composti TaxID=408558 RepID=UPI0005592654|nr:glycoside hydrolase family 88 protein [Comamonas composti]